MPKTSIDYSNTIFYQIYCKNTAVTDKYVGHTTNFVQRKHAHKRSCSKNNDVSFNLKLYQCIRDNGGWDNWVMKIVGFHNCHDHYEARKVEQQYFESLKATLNSIEPLPKPKPKNNEEKISETTLCNDEVNLSKGKKFLCKKCNYSTCKFSDWTKHTNTRKHKISTNSIQYSCSCGRTYLHASSLWNHKQKCDHEDKNNDDTKTLSDSDKIAMLLKQNEMLLKQNEELMNIIRN
jgi:hypothetical protein